jgi:nucleoside phosphorylase
MGLNTPSASTPPVVDVLIVTALQDELEAVLELGEHGRAGWSDERDAQGFRFHRRMLGALSVAAAWTGQMGETAAAVRTHELISELYPACLAMCGICAGKRGDVFLGDVIVADRVYSYDHGKLVAAKPGKRATLYQDIETYNLEQSWRVDAAYLARNQALHKHLSKQRPPSLEAQRAWLLRAAYAHRFESKSSPVTQRGRRVRCPAWPQVLDSLVHEGLLELRGDTPVLTGAGLAFVEAARARDPDWPAQEPPFQVHVGPIATGKTVRKDPQLFSRLERSVRKTLGVEMEAAALGYVAERRGLKLLIAKAVSDYGDGDKDDSFRRFACRASAEFVAAFLREHLTPARPTAKRRAAKPPPEPANPAEFSPSLVRQLELLHKHIRQLTEDQYRVIEFLQGHSRVAITGCAGSGKTLVAAEKAIRLDRAGLRTLLLCHSPHLARLLRQLTQGTRVEVNDFESWVQTLLRTEEAEPREWMPYREPGEAELTMAFDLLVARPDRYDAVIVDEGQDFRETWWTLVEAALKLPQVGTLYVFLDDNQALLPHRGAPPLERAPYVLSRNCRNAGVIFEVVRRLHPCAPEPALSLEGKGTIEKFPIASQKEARRAVVQAVQAALLCLPAERLVVLTTESDPTSQSVLEGLPVALGPQLDWQKVVRRHLEEILTTHLGKPQGNKILPELPELSERPVPAQEDVLAVNAFVQRVIGLRGAVRPHYQAHRLHWRVVGKMLKFNVGPSVLTIAQVTHFFGWTDWSQGLPTVQSHEIRSTGGGSNTIPLHTVAAFKGLEADGIVLYLRESTLGGGPQPEDPHRMAKAYVGVSRARFLLHIVGDGLLLPYL